MPCEQFCRTADCLMKCGVHFDHK